MNTRQQLYPRVLSGVPYECSNIGVSTTYKRAVPSDVCSAQVNRELQRRARSNGYSTTVSAEGYRLMNELVSHHRAVSDEPRDTQTSACRT